MGRGALALAATVLEDLLAELVLVVEVEFEAQAIDIPTAKKRINLASLFIFWLVKRVYLITGSGQPGSRTS